MTRADIIIEEVARAFGVSPDHMRGRWRLREHTRPRHIAMALCRIHLGMSSPAVARAFNREDHTSVLYAQGRAKFWLSRPGIASAADAAWALARARIKAQP